MSYLRKLLTPKVQLLRFVQCPLSTSDVQHCDRKQEVYRRSLYKTEKAKKLRFYFLTRYFDYIKNYDKILEKQFPAAMGIYRLFMDGCKGFIRDTKEYLRIVMLLNKSENNISKLLRREIELYEQLPKDMYQVAPVLIIFSIPLGPYIILPLAYAFPRFLLCSHFWTKEQKSKFRLLNLRDRLVHNRPIFRHLQSQMSFLRSHCLYPEWSNVIGMLASGTQPNVKEILNCKELFAAEPYHLLYLSSNHIKHLCKIHNIHRGWFRRIRLHDRARLLIEMDRAILREGGVHNLPLETLSNCCYLRGLNPTNVSNKEMISWLNHWIQLSSQMKPDCYSLLLHAPVLLAYNAPSNWQLIYEKK